MSATLGSGATCSPTRRYHTDARRRSGSRGIVCDLFLERVSRVAGAAPRAWPQRCSCTEFAKKSPTD